MWHLLRRMSKVDTDAFFDALDGTAPLPPVVCCGGAERVFVDDAVTAVRARVLQGGLADFNHDKVSLRDKRMPEIVPLCMTLPVMAKQRLVEVRDASAMNEADSESLSSYLERPSPDTVLLLLCGDIDLRQKSIKALEKSKNALLCRFDHPKDREMPQLAQRRAKKHGLKLGAGAADLLAATVGADLTLLERALEKLTVATDGEVSEKDVSVHVADTHTEDAFAFVAAVAAANRDKALAAAAALQAAREEPFRLLGLLAWQLRQVAQARALLDDGKDAAKELRLFGDRARPVITAAKSLSPERHARRLVQLAEADMLMKSSRQPTWLIMTRLVAELTTVERPSPRR